MKEDLERRDATVLIVGGGAATAARMAARFLKTPWPLLLDEGRAVCREFGLGRGLAVINESGTVLVDREGLVRYALSGLNPFKALDREALLAALDATETA